MEFILEIMLFICGMLKQVSILLNAFISHLLDFVSERFSWCSFSQMCILYYLGKHLRQIILIITLHDFLTNWSYQESLSMHGA